MKFKNAKQIQKNAFNVLDLVVLKIPDSPWWWHMDDFDDTKNVGFIAQTWGEQSPGELDSAYMVVVDATDDPKEVDVTKFQASGFEDTAEWFRIQTAITGKRFGTPLVEWQSCKLVTNPIRKVVTCAYIAMEGGKNKQYTAIRVRSHNRNIVIVACYDVSKALKLGPAILKALGSSYIIGDEPATLNSLVGDELLVKGLYTGGNGDSIASAIVLNTKDSSVGVAAEYDYIEKLHGRRNKSWGLIEQRLISDDNGRNYDVLKIQLSDKSVKSYYFDISAFY